MITEGQVFAERYRVEKFIGQGGMALVFRAVDVHTGHKVAIKVLKNEFNQDTEFLERFQREAQAASLMNHHNIVNLLDVGIEGEDRYLVFEYINGTTLRDIIDKKHRLSAKTSVEICIRILSALQHAHENHIIHRDIKPQNVLVNQEGLVKVADFGIARIVNKVTITRNGMVMGTVHYASPEQASGQDVTNVSDLYSAGIVLYEMLTGRVPFEGDNPVAVAMQHIQSPVPPIENFAPQTPPAVIAVVMKALQKQPENRFASARDMADALQKAMEGQLNIEELNKTLPRDPSERDMPYSPHRFPVKKEKTERDPIKAKKTRRLLIAVAAAFMLVAGAVALLLISNERTFAVPDLLDLSQEEAREQVEKAGFVWSSTGEQHQTIPKGYVIRQEPGPEERIKKGSTVTAVISEGSGEDRLMPNVVSMSYEKALERLSDFGISNIVVVKTVSTQPIGTVITQSPAPGSDLTEDLSVELDISGGSTLVPYLTGLNQEEALQALNEAGLTVGTLSYLEVPAEQVDTVVEQNPTGGSTAVQGASISLTIGLEVQPYSAELVLELPAMRSGDHSLKITLVVKNEEELLKYQGTLFENQSASLTIPLKSSAAGEVKCRIYVDDTLYEEQTLNFR